MAHGFFVTKSAFSTEGFIMAERFAMAEPALVTKGGVVTIAAQAVAIGMVMFHVVTKVIRRTTPMVPVIVVSPASIVAIH